MSPTTWRLVRYCFHESDSAGLLAIVRLVAIIMVMSETLPLATVKARFSEIVDRVARQQGRVIVTRNGQPAAVLVSTDDLESLEETLAVMSDRSLIAQIRASEKAAAAGDPGAPLDELRADLKRRRAARK
jgi:prevent-host-death family protein